MRVRLLKPWSSWSKGHVFTDMPGGQARALIARGIAEELRDDPLPPPGGYLDRQMRPARRARAARSA